MRWPYRHKEPPRKPPYRKPQRDLEWELWKKEQAKERGLRLLGYILSGIIGSFITALGTVGAALLVSERIPQLRTNQTRAAIVYLKEDEDSKQIAEIVKNVLKESEVAKKLKFTLVAKDSSWYAKYYTPEAVVNKCIELGYNGENNAWLVDGTPDPKSVYHTLKKAMFEYNSTLGWHRPPYLPLSKPELLWKVEDVRTRWDMEEEAGLERFAVIVVSPPSSWWKEEE